MKIFYFFLLVFITSCTSLCLKAPMVIAPVLSKDTLSNDWIALKYTPIMGISKDSIQKSIRIYQFINQWYGAPFYLDGQLGINDYLLVEKFYEDIFLENITKFSPNNYMRKFVFSKKYICSKQGDILFFRGNQKKSKTIVGIYLTNGKFILCDSKRGVVIESFFDEYWFKRFLKVGRLRKQYRLTK